MPRKNSSYIFVCLTNDNERENALTILNGYKWKGKELIAIVYHKQTFKKSYR